MDIITVQKREEVFALDINAVVPKTNYLLGIGHVKIYGQKGEVEKDVPVINVVKNEFYIFFVNIKYKMISLINAYKKVVNKIRRAPGVRLVSSKYDLFIEDSKLF